MNLETHTPTLTDCDREPIHQIPAIQHFGGLIAINADWMITQLSANCAEILGLDEMPKRGSPLSAILYPHAIDTLREAVERLDEDDQIERIFGVKLNSGGPLLDVALHRSGTNLAIEFEPHAEAEYADHLAMVGPLITRLDGIRDPQTLYETAAGLVRQMLGYDRVMVYRFHRDQSGEVVAEDKREDLDPYLGLRYPAADIPQQARELFVRNRFRIIADMQAEQIPIEPPTAFDGKPLDLSMSVLRAHSPMHVQYMRNMGVEASLAIAIVRHGKLWGMFSCHHYEPRLPPFSLRTVAEMFSQMFSLMLDRMLIARSDELRARGRGLHDTLMMRLAGGISLGDNLDMVTEMLRELIGHDGISVHINGNYNSQGAAPTREQFEALIPFLSAAPNSTVLSSSALGSQIEEAREFEDKVTGGLVVPISRSPRDYLALWRKPLKQTVNWAGDPAKVFAKGEDRLEPRSSFAEWAETVEGRSEEWTDDELVIAEGLRVSLLEVILRMTDEVARERKRAQEQQDLLIAELNHRVRNILNLIRSLVSQSQKDAATVESFAKIIGGRIAALATAHDNITRENWSPAPLNSLFETELQAYLNNKQDRLRMTRDPVLVRPEAYTVIALVVHELVTNSAKYGSLCDSRGTIDVDIGRAANGDLTIAWRERGGPPVKPPTRRGFGSTIIQRSIPHELRGEADLRFKLGGLEADFRIPARFVASMDEAIAAAVEPPQQASNDDGAAAPEGPLPENVLVVEDNMVIALDTEDCLLDLGVKKVRVESTVSGALTAIEEREPDFAIVDFNLGVESSLKVAEELSRRGVRFVLATGYSELSDNLDEFGASGLVRKPYGTDDIENALRGTTPK